jgi:hypothetical protein
MLAGHFMETQLTNADLRLETLFTGNQGDK